MEAFGEPLCASHMVMGTRGRHLRLGVSNKKDQGQVNIPVALEQAGRAGVHDGVRDGRDVGDHELLAARAARARPFDPRH